MATTYLSPGVYVEEVDRGTKPIEVVGASMPAFIGITAQASHKYPESGAPKADEIVLDRATLITNWTQFQTIFGGFVDGAYLPDAVYGYFNNGGGPCYVTSLYALQESGAKASVVIPAQNAGSKTRSSKKEDKESGSENVTAGNASFRVMAKLGGAYGNDIKVSIERERDNQNQETGKFTMVVNYRTLTGSEEEKLPGLFLKEVKDGENEVVRTIVEKGKSKDVKAEFDTVEIVEVGTGSPAENVKEKPYYKLLDGGAGADSSQLSPAKIIGDEAQRTGLAGLAAHDDVRLILCPDLMPNTDFQELNKNEGEKERIRNVQQAMIAQCERLKYCFAILDTPRGMNAQQAKEWHQWVNYDSSYAALYYPWVKVVDFSTSDSRSKFVPPSGYMAGIYNRVDSDRGIHKAPANEILQGVTGLEINLTKGEQDTLNPIGINCIRSFPGRGIRCWGGRTLSSDGSWRYVNVRRLFITVGASLDAGLQWVVFEPNDRTLWARVRRDINAFLGTFWLSGALFGATKDEAFYVKCDEELNPAPIRDLGQLIIEIGLSPVKPAEFVILRLSQYAGPNAEVE